MEPIKYVELNRILDEHAESEKALQKTMQSLKIKHQALLSEMERVRDRLSAVTADCHNLQNKKKILLFRVQNVAEVYQRMHKEFTTVKRNNEELTAQIKAERERERKERYDHIQECWRLISENKKLFPPFSGNSTAGPAENQTDSNAKGELMEVYQSKENKADINKGGPQSTPFVVQEDCGGPKP
ncbi:unnamed protein product [Calicophoron daubneyi]|uniref:Uncharacterized protein n=1 Tax=Calicophoron daubneyi TaxID=300641 RepID=A0AAV2T8Z2_CALDB